MRTTRAVGVVAVCLFGATGCATNLSTLQTGETLDQGQFRASGGMGLYIPAGQIVRAVSLSKDQAARLARVESGAEAVPDTGFRREVLETAAALAFYPPGQATELGVRYGILENFDAGLRYASTSWRGDVRYRFLHQGNFHVSAIAGVEKHRFKGRFFDLYEKLQKLFDLFKFVELEDPSRWDLEAGVIASWNLEEIFLPYFALKYRAALYKLPSVLTIEAPSGPVVDEADIKGVAHFIMATAGGGLGYKYAWVFVELNLAWVFSNPTLLGEPADLGGFTLYPAFGIAAEFP